MEPDSWEDIDNATDRGMANLNINAPSFVPSPFATSFVPRFGGAAPPPPPPAAAFVPHPNQAPPPGFDINGFQAPVKVPEPVADINM